MKNKIICNSANYRFILSFSSKNETSCSAIGGNFSRTLRSKLSGIYALLIVMISMFLFSSESFSVQIIRPDGIAHGKSFYGVDMSGGGYWAVLFPPDFDYFDCP